MKTKKISRYSCALAIGLALTLTVRTQAQTEPVPPVPPVPPPADETVVLTRFVVNTDKDNGYTAVDSLSGGRQNSPIRVTPAAMSSITSAFINDLSLTNVQDALKWSLNAIPTDFRNGISGASGGEVFNFWSISIRGDAHVQGGNPPTKNYFPTFMVQDTYNVDRIEFDSGPNSILFGIGDIGGSMATYTKVARFDKNFSDVVLTSSNYGGYRATIDVNQSVNKNLALRLNAVSANEKGWRDGDMHKKAAVDLAATWKFSDSTQLRFEIEGWKEKKTVFAQSIQDGTSLWNKTASAATWGAVVPGSGTNPVGNPGAPGVTTMGAWGGPANYFVWTPSVGLFNWGGGTRSMGTGDINWGDFLRPSSFVDGPSGATIMALPSKHFAVSPADGLLKPEDINMTLNFDHKFNENCEFEISGYRYVDDAKAKNFEGAGGGQGVGVAYDLNKQLPNGATNPNFGKLFSDFFLDAQTQDHWVNEIRGQFSYHFDTTVMNVPLKQLFSVSAGQQETEYDARQYQATVMNNYDPNNWTQSMVWGRVYWDAPQRALSVPTSYNGQTIAYIPLPYNWYDFNSKQTIKYFGAFSQTRLWDDRLNVSLGIRHDSYDNWKVGLRGNSNPPTISSGSGNTYSAGFVGYVTDWLGVVGNLSDNYQPAAGGLAPSVFGKVFGPSFGKGKNIGLRVSTKDGKYYASLNYYNDRSHDVIGGDSPDLQGMWNDYFAAGGTNTSIGPAGNVTGGPGTLHANMSYADTYDVKYTGVELEVTANPTKNLRLQFHYSAPKGEKTNDGPNGVAYFNQNLAIWQAAAGGASPASVKLAQDIANAKTNFATWANPVLSGGVVKSMANVFATYSFTEDALRGFEIGGGAAYLGQQRIDQVNFKPSYTTYSLLLGYSRTFDTMDRKVHARFQVNVDNLFGDNTLVWQNYMTYGANQSQAMDYNVVPPRKVTVSASFSF